MRPSDYKKRLLALVAFLENLPNEKFFYGTWVSGYNPNQSTKSFLTSSECGTTACALGWACLMPKFKKFGLRLVGGNVFSPLLPNCGNSYESASKLFGIDTNEAVFLFQPSAIALFNGIEYQAPPSSASVKEVAIHLRNFAELKWPSKKKINNPSKNCLKQSE